MSMSSDEIFIAALELSESERISLVARLMETVPDSPIGFSIDDPALIDELHRRSADTEGSVPWNELRDML